MCRPSLAIALSLFLVSASTSQLGATVLTPKDSSSFNFKYEMDVLPNDDDQGGSVGGDWVAGSGGDETGGPPSVNNGIMTLTASDPFGAFYYSNGDTGGQLDWNLGYTIEFRLRILSQDEATRNAVILWGLPGIDHNDKLVWLNIRANGVNWGDIGVPAPTGIDLSSEDNTDDFHVFRVAKEAGADTNAFSVWRDGVLLSETLVGVDAGSAGSPAVEIGFGDAGARWLATTEIDYLRFDTTGAFAPPPRPGDFNSDSYIDGTDFLLWQRGVGITGGALPSDGDANDDGNVDGEDLLIWKAGFGTITGTITPVPEPGAVAMAFLSAAGIIVLTRQRRLKQRHFNGPNKLP